MILCPSFKTVKENILTLKRFLYFNSLSFFKFDVFELFGMIIGNLPKKINLFIGQTFINTA